MVEGITLLRSALDAGAEVESVFVDVADGDSRSVAEVVARAHASGARTFSLAPGVLRKVADTVTPQPVLAVVHTPRWTLEDLSGAGFVVVCVDVRDPGNAGAVIRTADAAGADAVVCCAGTVDPYNPKTVRASAGSVLHVPVVEAADPLALLERLGGLGLRRWGTAARGGSPYTGVDLTAPCAVVLGNEAHGLPPSVRGLLDGMLTIPMAGRAESLNVAMAASVLCFEVRRQRSSLPGMSSGAHQSMPGVRSPSEGAS